MANNQYVNKVSYDGTTLIDLTIDTAVASDVAQGKYFHLASGERVVGTATGGGTEAGTVYQDANGYIVLDDESGKVYQTVTKTYTPSTSQQTDTITPTTGYDAIAEVDVTINAVASGAYSVSAAKGPVSNHSVSVTPTATIGTAGYIAAGSTNGTAVTVTASELASGNLPITANTNSTSCVGYSTVSVNVPTVTITQTGSKLSIV